MENKNIRTIFSDFLRYKLQNKTYSVISFWVGFLLAPAISLLVFFGLLFNNLFFFDKPDSEYRQEGDIFSFDKPTKPSQQMIDIHNNINTIIFILLGISIFLALVFLGNFLFWYLKQFRKYPIYLKGFAFIFKEENQIKNFLNENKLEQEFEEFKAQNLDLNSIISQSFPFNIKMVYSYFNTARMSDINLQFINTQKPSLVKATNLEIDVNPAFSLSDISKLSTNNFDQFLQSSLSNLLYKAVLYKLVSQFVVFFTLMALTFEIAYLSVLGSDSQAIDFSLKEVFWIFPLVLMTTPISLQRYFLINSLKAWFRIYLTSIFMLKERITQEISEENEEKLSRFTSMSDEEKIKILEAFIEYNFEQNKSIFSVFKGFFNPVSGKKLM
ncbi:hypothetical protein [Mesomycoplasma hyorhinis]|uniref:Uncharacterized protein n=2 Tax=Mesomycoplasma hyorhinis TaxID=2100 RepID=A0ABD6II90_MESHY|nr:hypothetical protein [Mesomycoplasma hyorhinis]MXR06841.1 hypothetical protein [Mesomycoplasma hyorhinis]MXR08317.1 hypothetical protein [Mesomycoplasma hyorhinis]MXR08790.1 hypothetical protein [Mesomycoplasma hyorhinis]MXR09795.1 hypothetical protein [Mesomycoplasma hyorhinis]MXR11907.1 hypothetical protein [Mesomycoplasma hyorhinis]